METSQYYVRKISPRQQWRNERSRIVFIAFVCPEHDIACKKYNNAWLTVNDDVGSLTKRFPNDCHSSLVNRLLVTTKTAIHGKPSIILYIIVFVLWTSYQIVKLRVAHALGMISFEVGGGETFPAFAVHATSNFTCLVKGPLRSHLCLTATGAFHIVGRFIIYKDTVVAQKRCMHVQSNGRFYMLFRWRYVTATLYLHWWYLSCCSLCIPTDAVTVIKSRMDRIIDMESAWDIYFLCVFS